ncbi:MAG: carotenoid oxygenase family protein, partial [Parvularculaceae bacterium]|nr:carotenoid oxygenase family protein [Parvularculaceae bacterium]
REEQIDDTLSEFPVVNLDYTGRRSRWSYHVVMDDHVLQRFSALRKYDLDKGSFVDHAFPAGVFGSEPAFAPKIGARDEDDGYVVTFTTDLENGRSECVVIDAKNFHSAPIARIEIPARVPAGFHGTWAPLT